MWRRTITLVCLVLATGGACRPDNGKALAKAAGSIASKQRLDEAAVTRALKSMAKTEDEQLDLAKRWDALPTPPPRVPAPAAVVSPRSELRDELARALESAACEAVLDMLRSGRVPDARTFLEDYVSDVVLGQIPQYVAQGVAEDFQSLYDDAAAGTLTYRDFRLTVMKYQYCG